MRLKVLIEIPEEFYEEWFKDALEESLQRLVADSHCLAGQYEIETANMLIDALKNSEEILEV